MDYCGPLGLPHSQFLSWSEDDQDKALAWTREKRLTCTGCGTRRDEWEQDRFAYVADAYRCPGCELLQQERRNIPEGEGDGVQIYLIPRQLATALVEGYDE